MGSWKTIARGKRADYEVAAAFLDRTCERVGLAPDKVVCVPGNHDIDRDLQGAGIMPAKETTAQAIATYLCDFLEFKSIDITKMRGIGFDGTNTMSGQRSGVQKRLRLHSPSAVYVHCQCHQLQLATLNAADEHREVK